MRLFVTSNLFYNKPNLKWTDSHQLINTKWPFCGFWCLSDWEFLFTAIYRVERLNCRPGKDDTIPFPFNENQFSFIVADRLLVGQLCTNPKSDRSLLSCLKVTQCSRSEIRDAPLRNSCSLPIQVMTTGPLPAPSKCKSGRFNMPRVMKRSFPATAWCGFTWGPHNRSRHESQHQSVLGCAEECGELLVQSGSQWQTLGVAAGLDAVPQVQRDLGLTSEWVLRLCTRLSLAPSSPDLNPPDYFI